MPSTISKVPPCGRRTRPLLLCFSHLRWDFVYQRPQHLMTRAAANYDVVFFEEPVFAETSEVDGPARLERRRTGDGILIATPRLPAGLGPARREVALRRLLDALLAELGSAPAACWYYSPLALGFSRHLRPATTVYDCMDELTLFRGASPLLASFERQLLERADLVFAGGRSLHESKRRLHGHVHLFPSSVDVAHFSPARGRSAADPADQRDLGRPRVGYFGVLDERIDYALLDAVAVRRPDWTFVLLGPFAKVDPATLPRRDNLRWLGMKPYAALPGYLAGWDAGMMPFALNEATRFISPTKTPEFLAAGVPVVSTAVRAGGRGGGRGGRGAGAAGAPAVGGASARVRPRPRDGWIARVDRRLALLSWDATWAEMSALMEEDAAPSGRGRAVGSATPRLHS